MEKLHTPPVRGFSDKEFELRTQNLQKYLQKENIGAVFFTTEAEVRYFSGFDTQFWLSPTRPWFLVVPDYGKPIAVIPEIGMSAFQKTWIKDIRTWSSPQIEFDGIDLLAETLKEVLTAKKKLGVMLGSETCLRMPVNDYQKLLTYFDKHLVVDIASIIKVIRSVKSQKEIEKIKFITTITEQGFCYLREYLQVGMSERQAAKAMQTQLLKLGADSCPYLACASGQGGYQGIISGPTDRLLQAGDIFVLDTGACFDGYFSDFDRNYGFISISPLALKVHHVLYEAIAEALNICKPEITTFDIWQKMWSVLKKAGASSNNIGRMGHGLGLQLTEWPSNAEYCKAPLKTGMVLTLEPAMIYDNDKIMVSEENIVITENGCELLHPRTWENMPIITE